MSTSSDVVPAGIEHLDALVPLLDGYRVFYGQPSAPEACREFLDDRLSRQDSTILLARRAQEALGFAQLYPLFSTVQLGPAWLLNDLYVAADGRRSGIGSALLEAVREFGVARGAVRMTLATSVDNHPAKKLYERHGWRMNSTFDHYRLDFV
ncbi:GNAT family N-acetyltransferase [Halotalea alkalilenta]|uniref:GNAT family N-acetyltransferase n=1 Tax=Halotalea alkalilenta TaxID=376489 RepID=UPI0005B8D920|nr:GNAT family N-acetyltransferase [Halotalea alkalilenta]